jgi:hypothetical protein
MLIKYFENQNLTINFGWTVQGKTTIISFTCIAEINYTQSHTFKYTIINHS